MLDERTISKDVDPATLFDRCESAKESTVNSIIELLKGTTDQYDNIEQVLDDFVFNVRFETIYLYENGPWVSKPCDCTHCKKYQSKEV